MHLRHHVAVLLGLMMAGGPVGAAALPAAAAPTQATSVPSGQPGDSTTTTTVADEPTTAAREAARLHRESLDAIRDLGPHELQFLVTPIHRGKLDSATTRTMWVLKKDVFLARVDGRTGLQLFVRREHRWTYNPATNRYYRWTVFPPEPPISPEGQGLYLVDEAEYQGEMDHPELGPVWHLRAIRDPENHLDVYLSRTTKLPLRTEMVGRVTTIREDMRYRKDSTITSATLEVPLPPDAKEVLDTALLR